ncbi:MAG TPA: Ldh family oxidoreductase [Solirubrobacteraceae bacterium]|nr:Ldh family oxidoreductase [Solirubrobacteraceae bacterium]
MAETTLSADELYRVCITLLHAVGTPDDLAAAVAGGLHGANLAGHDSHGLVRLPMYVRDARDGKIQPATRAEVVRRRGATACVSARRGWGQPAARLAAQTAAEIASEHGVGAVILQDSPHVGRMADYVELIAARGQLGMTVTNAHPNVAPFGGRARRLGTDPIAFAIPRDAGRPPIVVDFATSVRAEGKVRVARAAGRTVPAGTLIDAEGRPSVNPEDYYAGGALLPAEGHKGYALAVAIEGLGGILSGMGPAMLPAYGDGNGMFVMALEIEAFISVEQYMRQVEEMALALESTPTAPGVERVLLPGQPELLSAERRRREGIPIADATMAELRELANELGATLPVHG